MDTTFAHATQAVIDGMQAVSEMPTGLLQGVDEELSVVGLGGSAGSIAALQQFFVAMPADSGMAFIVILHGSSRHDGTWPEFFQRSTAMPVVAAADGMRLQPNVVYVTPPGKFRVFVDGLLSLTDAHDAHCKRGAVDRFFRALAESHGARALAVVFSGAGGDGALGLERIKELGGLTIAQDPDEAEHPEMPRSAIANGVVDWVLGVHEMPTKLLDCVKQRGEMRLPGDEGPHPAQAVELFPNEHEAALRDVLALLNTRTGRDFSCYKRATILRRIARRMQVNGLTDLPSYLGYMRTHAGEASDLLQDLLISVTNFFRDPASFAALERTIPELFKGKTAGDKVRVWVAGCATGEEAYSIAMLLCEHAATLVGPPQLQVFATDLDEEVIREAREGLYPETIAADVSEERLRQFFILERGGYRVRRRVREMVLFTPHDLLKDSPFSRLDLVSCRNLLIYLKREAQNRAFDVFHFALRPEGRLFLGTSESVDEGSPLFTVLDKKQRLYAQRPGPQRVIGMPAGPGTLARVLALQERTRERPPVPERISVDKVQAAPEHAVPPYSGLPPGELHYRLIERFSPPSILVNSAHEIVHLSASAGRYLQFTGGEPSRNLCRTILPLLRVQLRAALYAAAQTQAVATALRVPVALGAARSLVDLRVTPAGDLAPGFLLVVFDEHPADGLAAVTADGNVDADQAALHLERELVATKAQLRDTIEAAEVSTEELKASNEELQAMNEELQAMNEELGSATEELETSREELQSINDELTTVNDELKISLDELARSNSDLQNLMAATDIATVFLDRELRIQRFTPSARALFKFIPADVGRLLADLTRQFDHPDVVADAERSLAHLEHAQREVCAGDHWYVARTLPYRTADDRIAGVVITFLDITTQKRVERRLMESEARYRAIGESIDYGVWVCDAEGRNTYASDSFLRMAGITQQQCSDFGWGDVLHPDDAEATIAAWKECVLTQGTWDRVHRFKGKQGQWHHVLGRGVPLRDGSGEVIGWAGLNLDITRILQAEQEVVRTAAESQRQRRLYETVLTNTPDFVYVFSLDYKVVYANDALIKMWGRGDDGAIGKTFLEIGYEPWHAAMHEREIDQVRATRQPVRGEVPYNGTNGRRQYDYIFVPVIGADGEVEAVAGTTRDVTERNETERQLRGWQEQLDFALAAADLGHWSLNLADRTARRTLRHDQIFGYGTLLPSWTYEMFLEHVVPQDRVAVDAAFQAALASGSAWAVECRIRRADGAVRHIWTKALVRHDAGGQVEGMVGIVGDITDRRQAEDRQAFLARLADALRPLSDPGDVQAEASRLLGELLGVNRVVHFENRGGEYVIDQHHAAGVQPLAGCYPVPSLGAALLRELLAGRTVVEADATLEPYRTASERAAFAAIQVLGHVDVPLVKNGRLMAGMTVQVCERRDWTPSEVGLIEDAAERIWAAVERVRIAAALRASEESRRLALDAAELGTFNIDPTTNALTSDARFRTIFAGCSEPMDYQQAFAALHPDDRERIQEAVAAATRIDSPTPYAEEYRVVHPDGAVRWVFAKGRANFAGEGPERRLVSFDGTISDITARKQAEMRVLESEQRFRLVADAAPVMIWMSGTDKLMSWYNQPWLDFTGRTLEEEIGLGAMEVVHPDDLVRTVPLYNGAFDARTALSMEYRLRRWDGEYRWMICSGVPRYRADGEFEGYIGSCVDVTDYKNAEAELREADRRKDEFLATLAHELRNPLAPIRSGLQVIQAVGADATIEQARSMMERQLLQLTRLVDDLLDISRLTTAKLELRVKRLQLRDVVAAALETSRPVIEQHGHFLSVSVPTEPIFVDGDPIRLAQVVSNLLINSAKYTHRGGHISLSVSRDESTAVLAVTDNGIGIPHDMLQTVFGMFTQVDRALEKATGGLGIGLSLARGLIEMHGGSIEAFSEGEGRGSTFSILIPVATSESTESEPSDAMRTDTPTTDCRTVDPLRILIVDDNADAADSLGQLLEIMGHDVRTAYDGESAIEVAGSFRPSVMLCDIGMPKMNGYDTARSIRTTQWGRGVILVALTGWGQQDDVRKSLAAGFDHHLTKPVEPDTLLQLLCESRPRTV